MCDLLNDGIRSIIESVMQRIELIAGLAMKPEAKRVSLNSI